MVYWWSTFKRFSIKKVLQRVLSVKNPWERHLCKGGLEKSSVPRKPSDLFSQKDKRPLTDLPWRPSREWGFSMERRPLEDPKKGLVVSSTLNSTYKEKRSLTRPLGRDNCQQEPLSHIFYGKRTSKRFFSLKKDLQRIFPVKTLTPLRPPKKL